MIVLHFLNYFSWMYNFLLKMFYGCNKPVVSDVFKSMDTQWCMSFSYLKFSYYGCKKSIKSISIGCYFLPT
jgi:hypothetical protein